MITASEPATVPGTAACTRSPISPHEQAHPGDDHRVDTDAAPPPGVQEQGIIGRAGPLGPSLPTLGARHADHFVAPVQRVRDQVAPQLAEAPTMQTLSLPC